MVAAVLQRSKPRQARTRGTASASRRPSSRPGKRGFAAPGAAQRWLSAQRLRLTWGRARRAAATPFALPPSGGPG